MNLPGQGPSALQQLTSREQRRYIRQQRSHQSRARLICNAAVLAPVQETTAPVLPPSLRNNCVVLDAPNPQAPGGTTRVYLLGMSHVSKASVQQVKDLVRAVRPDVVGVELCRDRLPLLVDPNLDSASNLMWHSRRIAVDGLPGASEWPQWDKLRALLTCQPGRAVTQQDIEGDVVTLLSTGLFRSVRPACQTASYSEAPEFLILPAAQDPEHTSDNGNGADSAHLRLQPVPPLQCIKFIVQERILPPITEMSVRVDSSLKMLENPESDLASICEEAKASNAPNREGGQVPALTCLLKARQSIAALFTAPVVVSFTGVETGKVEALVRLARDTDPPVITGFEASASGGEGWGIEAFRPKKNLFKISDKLFLPMEVIDDMRTQARGGPASSVASSQQTAETTTTSGEASTAALSPPETHYRPWTEQEINDCKPPMFVGSAFNDTLGAIVTGLYAKYQSQAARKLGLTPGAAWQAALQAATEVGSQQVMLIDRPTVVTERRLSDALVAQTGWRFGAAAGLVLSTLIGFIATDILDPSTELAAFTGTIAAGLGLLWPIIGPLREMKSLADMTPEQIEASVAVQRPIASGDLSQPLKLFGEDALLDWPGAMGPVIRDRDAYMSRALAGAATGDAVFSPVYVRDEVDGQSVWRYMMPDKAPEAAAPVGLGDGAAQPLKGVRTVVGIVGSAHVPGMVREWQESLKQPASVDNLLTAE